MERLIWETAEEMNFALAKRVKNIRRRKNISQEMLAKKSGVSYGSIKRFERTGNISLLSLTKIAMALGCSSEIRKLFLDMPYESIQEVIYENR